MDIFETKKLISIGTGTFCTAYSNMVSMNERGGGGIGAKTDQRIHENGSLSVLILLTVPVHFLRQWRREASVAARGAGEVRMSIPTSMAA
jgi:hypothetical protein